MTFSAIPDVLDATVERLTIKTGLSFGALVAEFEKRLAHYEFDVGAALIDRGAAWGEVEREIDDMVGDKPLVLFLSINQGEFASLKGLPRHCKLYLVGNPVIATEIVNIDIRGAMLVPFRVELYEEDGVSCVSYDRPSSFLATLGNPALDAIGTMLDAKIDGVAAALAAISDPVGA